MDSRGWSHDLVMIDNIPLKLPKSNISNKPIERANSIKFLGVSLDEKINWKDHIRAAELK